MRIAVCISGFLRTWKYTKKSFIEQLVNPLINSNSDYDLFIHTYRQNLHEFTAEEPDTLLTDQDILDLFSGLNIKSLIVEDREIILPIVSLEAQKYSHISNYGLAQKESSDVNSKEIPIGVRTYDHLRKIHLCNESRKKYERENGVKYDLVVKTRFDIVYFNPPNWLSCLDGKVHFGYGATFGWPDDTFCICIPEVMDRAYANRFLLCDEMFGTKKEEEKVSLCAHGTLKYILEKEKVEIGERVINMNCFRSKNSFQFYQDYRKKCDIDLLYEKLTEITFKDIYTLEQYKVNLLANRDL